MKTILKQPVTVEAKLEDRVHDNKKILWNITVKFQCGENIYKLNGRIEFKTNKVIILPPPHELPFARQIGVHLEDVQIQIENREIQFVEEFEEDFIDKKNKKNFKKDSEDWWIVKRTEFVPFLSTLRNAEMTFDDNEFIKKDKDSPEFPATRFVEFIGEEKGNLSIAKMLIEFGFGVGTMEEMKRFKNAKLVDFLFDDGNFHITVDNRLLTT